MEFSPEMAGQDVTPANLSFSKRLKKAPGSTSFQSIAGWLIFYINQPATILYCLSVCFLDTLSQLAINAVKPMRFPNSEFRLLEDEQNMPKETSIEVNYKKKLK